jgi:lysophospholipase L1-like esterase
MPRPIPPPAFDDPSHSLGRQGRPSCLPLPLGEGRGEGHGTSGEPGGEPDSSPPAVRRPSPPAPLPEGEGRKIGPSRTGKRVGSSALASLLALSIAAPSIAADRPLEGVRRVVFLGDSITYSGQYVEFVEAYLRLKDSTLRAEFLDLGLPSETVSGLSEPGHAGGQFPRPDLAERLDRVLAKLKPDLVVACYGMNDGIYYPFAEGRFAKYREGMAHLRERATASGAKVLHLTPPVFDPVPIKASTLPAGLAEYPKPFEGYDDVLGRYSEWLLARKADGWDVVDVHGPMKKFLDERRVRDPNFRLANDGVHIDPLGHWLIAREILTHWGIPAGEVSAEGAPRAFVAFPMGPEVLKLVARKQPILRDALLLEVGHKRPGMAQGLPMDEAMGRTRALEAEIRRRLGGTP